MLSPSLPPPLTGKHDGSELGHDGERDDERTEECRKVHKDIRYLPRTGKRDEQQKTMANRRME